MANNKARAFHGHGAAWDVGRQYRGPEPTKPCFRPLLKASRAATAFDNLCQTLVGNEFLSSL
jgi:hypothetical protein